MDEDIKEEQQGVKHYKEMAQKSPKNKAKYLSMARDEAKHAKMLKSMCLEKKKHG